jgi:hypothetical protein
MKLVQISVFLENRAGRLAEVTKVLGDAGVNIRALSLADTSDFGILRLIVDKTEEAIEALRFNKFTASLTEVMAVEVDDRPGGLAHVLSILQKKNINVEYMYAFVEKFTEKAVLVFRFENLEEAIQILGENGVRVLKGEEVRSL